MCLAWLRGSREVCVAEAECHKVRAVVRGYTITRQVSVLSLSHAWRAKNLWHLSTKMYLPKNVSKPTSSSFVEGPNLCQLPHLFCFSCLWHTENFHQLGWGQRGLLANNPYTWVAICGLNCISVLPQPSWPTEAVRVGDISPIWQRKKWGIKCSASGKWFSSMYFSWDLNQNPGVPASLDG